MSGVYAKVFQNIHRQVVEATETMFNKVVFNPTLPENREAVLAWLRTCAAAYGITPPHFVIKEDDRRSEGEYLQESHTILLCIASTLLELFKQFRLRHYAPGTQGGPGEIPERVIDRGIRERFAYRVRQNDIVPLCRCRTSAKTRTTEVRL